MSTANYNTIEPVKHVLDRLESVRSTGQGKWVARCPAHQDKSPSLSIRAGDNCGVLLFCFAGCPVADIVAAVGLGMADLFPPREPGAHRSRPMAPRIGSSDVVEALKDDLLALALFFRDVASDRNLSAADMRYASKHAMHLAAVISEVQTSGR